jgi:HAD superfamily hydrolase (TIGR01509 family)
VPALIFDCDGVLADTERDGHRPAFNQAFAEAGLDVVWDEAEYARRLQIGGGKERIASVIDDPDEVLALHKRKTALYKEMVRAGKLPARPGIARVVEEAIAAGWMLAVASTSAEESVRAVLEHAVGEANASHFAVFAGDIVPAKKPDPAIYLLTIDELGIAREDAIVVEDSRNGLRAAVGAGLRCVVTVSSYTADEDMSEAALVVTSLGDPGEPARVLADRAGVGPGEEVTLADLDACRTQPMSEERTV